MLMRKYLTLFSFMLLLSACSSNYYKSDSTSGTSTTEKTKGQLINECMTTGTPEQCDRDVNRRHTSY